MSPPNDGLETTVLETKSILIKNQKYHVVLTSRRIIFTGYSDQKPRSMSLSAVLQVEPDTDDYGNPVLIVSSPSVYGEIKKVILCFPKRDFPDAQQLQSLWYSEIRKRTGQPATISRGIMPTDLSTAPVFCMQCGNRLAPGSFFCNRCGAKIPDPVRPMPPGQRDGSMQERSVQPAVLRQDQTEPTRKKSPVSRTENTVAERKDITEEPVRREKWMKKPVLSGSTIRKSALAAGTFLVAVIIAAAALSLLTPSGSPESSLTSPATNISLPHLGDVKLPFFPEANTETNPESPVNPEKPSLFEDLLSGPEITIAPGDPRDVLADYPALFNNGDDAELRDLLSENMQSQYPPETLNTELAASRAKGYSIQEIAISETEIDGVSAVIDADIYWETPRSSTVSSPKIFVVYEADQWRLDSLIISP